VPPVKVLPQVDAGGAQTKSIAAIRVKENGPVVKLLRSTTTGLAMGFSPFFMAVPYPFPIGISRTEHYLIEGA
jgi:hypothetical protein